MFAPSVPFAAVLTFIVYFLPYWRFADGLNVTVLSPEVHAAIHVIDGVALAAPSVAVLFMALLKVMAIVVVTDTFTSALFGVVLVTVGGTPFVVNENE
jgi:hypothetical protein